MFVLEKSKLHRFISSLELLTSSVAFIFRSKNVTPSFDWSTWLEFDCLGALGLKANFVIAFPETFEGVSH